jgi:Ca2+/Na+ antiporter
LTGLPELYSMEIVWFSLVAILLYFASDWLVRRIEAAAGRTLEYRSLLFFGILLVLALATFALIRRFGA